MRTNRLPSNILPDGPCSARLERTSPQSTDGGRALEIAPNRTLLPLADSLTQGIGPATPAPRLVPPTVLGTPRLSLLEQACLSPLLCGTPQMGQAPCPSSPLGSGPNGRHQAEAGPHQIRAYLWLGDGEFAQNRSWLHEHGIHTIINASREIPCAFPKSFVYVHLPILDQSSTQLGPYWRQVHPILQTAKQTNQPVLIHCQQGISRSAALVLAHLMQEEGLTLGQAFAQVRGKRSCIEPNPGFLQQLRQLEQERWGQIITTQGLTFLDAGWQSQEDHRASRWSNKIQQLLGQAAAHQPLGAQAWPDLLEELGQFPLTEQCPLLVSSIRDMLLNYGKLDSSCLRAHQALQHLLAYIGTTLDHGPQLLQQALAELFAEEDWGSLLLDVPHAHTIVGHWPDTLRKMGA